MEISRIFINTVNGICVDKFPSLKDIEVDEICGEVRIINYGMESDGAATDLIYNLIAWLFQINPKQGFELVTAKYTHLGVLVINFTLKKI